MNNIVYITILARVSMAHFFFRRKNIARHTQSFKTTKEWNNIPPEPKNDGSYQCRREYLALNKVDLFPVPNLQAFFSKLTNKTRYSKIVLFTAYQ